MSLPSRISDLIQHFAQHIDSFKSSNYNEIRARIEFIDPFFKELGWDIENTQGFAETYKDVIHEDAIKVEGSTKAPDYSFRIGGQRKFFLEAKKPSVNVKDDLAPAYQLRRYAWNAGLPVSILTDFEEFAVYDTTIRPNPKDKASTARIFYCTYKEFEQHWEYISSIFSKDAILKGSFDQFVKDSKKKKGTTAVDKEFLREMEKWRNDLAKNIALRNTIDIHALNYVVQATIDRILFLRICEDRNIEEYGRLQKLAGATNIYKKLTEFFEQADEKYNSGLFHFHKEKENASAPDEISLRLKIDDKILKEIITALYFPSPYEFSVISADILGNVYEQFLGKVIRLTPSGQAKVEEKPEVKKAGGVYYTPQYIVKYIVENTVGELLKEKTPMMVAGKVKGHTPLRILDPACGSGSFLIYAYQYLLDWHRDWYEKDIKSKGESQAKKWGDAVYQGPGNHWYLTTREKKQILLNNIFGVDIDHQAVEVTKLNLLLKVLEGENRETLGTNLKLFQERALPDLAENIKCGNSLIGSDFYSSQGKNQADLFVADAEERHKVNDFDWETEFPFVIQTGGFDAVIGNPPYGNLFENSLVFQYIVKNYSCAEYKVESYTTFIEKSIQTSRDRAIIGLIVPYTFVSGKYFSKTRALLSKCLLEKVVILGKKVFDAADVDTTVVIIRNEKPKKQKIRISDLRKAENISDLSSIEYFASATEAVFSSYPKQLLLQPESRISLFRKLNQNQQKLQAVLDFYHGLQTRGDSKAIVEARRNARCLPLIKGSDFHRYQFSPTEKYIVFSKENIKSGGDLRYHQAPEKIIIRTTADSIVATIDRTRSVCLNSVNIAVLLPGLTYDLRALLGILNSRLMKFWYDMTVQETGKTFAELKLAYLYDLPLPKMSSMKALATCVEQIFVSYESLQTSKVPSEKIRIERQIDATDREIDNLVYQLYGLTEDEIKIVEGA